jgi:hypothetical protein
MHAFAGLLIFGDAPTSIRHCRTTAPPCHRRELPGGRGCRTRRPAGRPGDDRNGADEDGAFLSTLQPGMEVIEVAASARYQRPDQTSTTTAVCRAPTRSLPISPDGRHESADLPCPPMWGRADRALPLQFCGLLSLTVRH